MISVIIPTRDRPQFLRETVDCALAQNVDMELIIVDDASEKDIRPVLDGIPAAVCRVIRSPRPLGGAGARNLGLAEARGELVAFLDDDDLWLAGKLAAQAECLRRGGERTVMVYCGYHYLQQETNRTFPGPRPRFRGEIHRTCLDHCITPTSTVLARREALRQAGGFDETLPAGQDWDLWIRLSRLGAIDFIGQDLVALRVHGAQISTSLEHHIQARETIRKKYAADIERDPLLAASHRHRLGMLYLLAGDSRKGRTLLAGACRRHWRLRYLIHLTASLFPPLYRALVRRLGMFRAGKVVFYH